MDPRTQTEQRPMIDRPWPLIAVTVLSYALAAAITVNASHSDEAAALAASPTPYSADHARIAADASEELPATF